MRISVFLFAGLLMLGPAAVRGQDNMGRVTLAEALEAFAENSLALRIARAEASEIAGQALQSRSYSNPAISLLREDLGHMGEGYWEATTGIEQRIEWPGRTNARARAAGHAVRGAEARLRADSIRLVFEVREAYARAWLAEENERTVGRAADVIEDVAEAAERRLEAGDISLYEVRRLRLASVGAGKEAADAALEAGAARGLLAALIVPESEIRELAPAEAIGGLPPAILRQVALEALSGRPDLAAAARDVDAARAESAVAMTEWVPDPTLSLGYKEHADGLRGASFGVNLPIPLFDRGRGARQQAAARADAAAFRLGLRRRQAEFDLVTASARYGTARTRLETTGDDLLSDAEAILEAARAAYAEGEMTLVEFLDAARAFRDARLSALALRAEAWIAYYDLLRAMGGTPEEGR